MAYSRTTGIGILLFAFGLSMFQQRGFGQTGNILAQTGPKPPTSTATSPSSSSTLESAPAITLHTSAYTVPLDIVVTDSHGEIVQGLDRHAFHIYEDGIEQRIDTFQEHRTPVPELNSTRLELPPTVYTNYSSVQDASALNVILMDALNTPLHAQMFAHEKVLEVLRTLPRGTRVAVFTLNWRLHMLQGFTSDTQALIAALGQKKALPYSAAFFQDLNQESLNDRTADLISTPTSVNDLAESAVKRILQEESNADATRIQLRVAATEKALQQLAGFLAGLPGRKNLIWISGSFPIIFDPTTEGASSYSAMPPMMASQGSKGGNGNAAALASLGGGDEAQRLHPVPFNYAGQVDDIIQAFTRAQVAVYSIDPRGLRIPSLYTGQDDGRRYAGHADRAAKDMADLFLRTTEEHATQSSLAEATGGHSFYGNAINEELRNAIRQGENYYSLSYSPTNHKHDGKFRHIRVRLDARRSKLAYRRGYYAESGSSTVPRSADVAVLAPALQAALQRGAPPYSEIPMKVRILPKPGAQKIPQTGNVKKDRQVGPSETYTIDYSVLTQAIPLKQNAKNHRVGNVEFLVVDYSAEGAPVSSLRNIVSLDLDPDMYQRLIHNGLPFHQEITVPHGTSFLHVAVHDLTADRIGSLELPLPTQPVATPSKMDVKQSAQQ